MPRGKPRLRTEDGALNSVGAQVRSKRLAANWFKDDLSARIAEITNGAWSPSESEIYKLEAGKRITGDLEIKVLARVLGCSILWLMGEE